MLGEGFGGLVIVPRIIVVRELFSLCWCSGGLTWRLGVGGVYICMGYEGGMIRFVLFELFELIKTTTIHHSTFYLTSTIPTVRLPPR
jgi:hypothetical protein